MDDKLRDYQVLDVFSSGTFYKVKHKATNSIFAWKAHNCSAYSSEHIQNIVNDVKSLSKLLSGSLLRYYDTILHGPSKTLYFILEYKPWQTLQELVDVTRDKVKYFSEEFLWHTLLEVVKACKEFEKVEFVTLQKCITPASIFVSPYCELRINGFDLEPPKYLSEDPVQQAGYVMKSLCCRSEIVQQKQEFMTQYSDDLKEVVNFMIENRSTILRPDVVLYHPTVLTNTDSLKVPKHISEILLQFNYAASVVNKCDSEKAVDMCNEIKPMPRTYHLQDSPIYCNIVPRKPKQSDLPNIKFNNECLSPTIAALALELPGYVPRSRKPYSELVTVVDDPQRVSQETLSKQWLNRIIALRQREESLNLRESKLIGKEIKNSPSTKVVCLDQLILKDSNGITLPPELNNINNDRKHWVSQRRRRRSGSARGYRKSYSHEDLDSSLSADNGDSSMVITAAKITKDNMPRNLFSDLSTKKVHFTPSNPFIDSDESVTLTFYDLDHVDKESYQVPRQDMKDITKFKYMNVDKTEHLNSEWSHSSPNKQAKISDIFSDTASNSNLRKTSSKSSISSKFSNISRCSMMSSKSQCSDEVGESTFERTRSIRQPEPLATPTVKKVKRKSLLPFKTPFKFMTSTKKI